MSNPPRPDTGSNDRLAHDNGQDQRTVWMPTEPEPHWLSERRRPEGVDDATVEAVGKLGEAVERLERARGHLYAFHQMCGTVDLMLGDTVDLLRAAGHPDHADALERHIVGRNVLDGRWSFQIVEEYDATYWSVVHDFAEHARSTLLGGATHVYESEMKERRRPRDLRHHEARPRHHPDHPDRLDGTGSRLERTRTPHADAAQAD